MSEEYTASLKVIALVNMRRRQSNTLDESDFSNAHQQLLIGKSADVFRVILSEAMTVLGALIAGIGINLLTGEGPAPHCGWLIISGTVLSIGGILFQHWPRK